MTIHRKRRSLSLGLAHAAHASSLLPSWRRFLSAARDPERAQAERLRGILRANANTAFGRAHGFSSIDSIETFRGRVPAGGFEEHAPWVERVERGERGVLTEEPVRMMEPTSGSTSPNKLIPFTKTFLAEIAAATHPWLFDLYRSLPRLLGTRSYWAISPATRGRSKTAGGIPIGIEDDTEYFGRLARRLLGSMMAVPPRIGRIQDAERWRWETCKHLLAAEDLGLISVWSPTFLTRLMEEMEERLPDLLACMPPPRARRIERSLNAAGGRLTGEAIWPRLSLVSCWADGSSRAFIPALRRFFPRTKLQPKGLLATEGVVSFPLWGREGSVLAVAGHFLELIDLDDDSRRPLLAHQVREGAMVSPVLTTSGGLYRYHLRDALRCVGRFMGTPLVRFEGRLDGGCDLAGEKLDELVVAKAIERGSAVCGRRWSFAMLAPELGSPPAYHLFLEGTATGGERDAMAVEVERALLEGAHYSHCRRMGQLGPVRAVGVSGALATLERARREEGRRLGQIKVAPLDGRTGWSAIFEPAGSEEPKQGST